MTFGQPKVTNRAGVEKYRGLALLRFVNDKDPVPLLPPLDITTILDEGPYKHFGPEVVLKDGTAYAYFGDVQAERFSVISFWNSLGTIATSDCAELPPRLPFHRDGVPNRLGQYHQRPTFKKLREPPKKNRRANSVTPRVMPPSPESYQSGTYL